MKEGSGAERAWVPRSRDGEVSNDSVRSRPGDLEEREKGSFGTAISAGRRSQQTFGFDTTREGGDSDMTRLVGLWRVAMVSGKMERFKIIIRKEIRFLYK